MTTLREAAQQALEALLTYEQYIQPLTNVFGGPRVPEEGSASAKVDAAITALRAALAEHDKKIVWVEERKAHWAEQLQLARETQERERQQREEAALAEPVQEPAAWMHTNAVGHVYFRKKPQDRVFNPQPLYTAPPQRKPLTEEEIKDCETQAMVNGALPFEQRVFFARAIERAHGIGEKE